MIQPMDCTTPTKLPGSTNGEVPLRAGPPNPRELEFYLVEGHQRGIMSKESGEIRWTST